MQNINNILFIFHESKLDKSIDIMQVCFIKFYIVLSKWKIDHAKNMNICLVIVNHYIFT